MRSRRPERHNGERFFGNAASRSWAALAAAGLLWVAGCGTAATGRSTDAGVHGAVRIVVSGSSTIGPLLREVAGRYERRHPGVRVDVQTGGSARGLSDVRRGLSDIGMVSRALTEAERDVRGYVIGFDAIAVIVHADNPVEELSMEQLREVYRGSIDRWTPLGGRDEPVVVVHKAEGRSTLEMFLRATGLDNREVRPDVVAGENEQVIKSVVANRSAIGYVSLGAALYDIADGAPIRVLPLDGVLPDENTVRSGTYPITRTLTLVTRPQPAPAVTAFLAFVRSADSADLFARWHFVQEVSATDRPPTVY
ncbi:MAG: phosphate ABC transporter substrate-binding protein [Planctomycetota bacterium]|nr:MAG: phosphate ABC transporter substrate-binding protein [Planctomycetota bacterium]